jgi:class 3 adenylate cyclase
MDSELRELLKDAEGKPQLVIAVNADIRGFSPFSNRDSYDVALFIKKVYIRLIDEYFSKASFIKPTGDGLLAVFHYTDSDYKEVIARTIRACLGVSKNFPSFFSGDSVVRFEVPKKIGIGLSSGTACRLVSGDNKTLDYSGKTLNLASRLMDFARPSGVVFDSSVGIELLPPELTGLFVKDKVCVRGIEEKVPVEIYHTEDTVILSSDREPKVTWRHRKKRVTVRSLTHLAKIPLRIDLPTPAADPKSIALTASFQSPELKHEGDKGTLSLRFDSSQLDYTVIGGKPMLRVKTENVVKKFRKYKLNPDEIVTFEVSYAE